MQKTNNKVQIIIPQGYFEGRCEECVHSCRTWQDKGNTDKDNREMYCAMYRKTFFPKNIEETNCSHYKMKLWCRVKRIIYIAIAIYIIIGFIGLILGF